MGTQVYVGQFYVHVVRLLETRNSVLADVSFRNPVEIVNQVRVREFRYITFSSKTPKCLS